MSGSYVTTTQNTSNQAFIGSLAPTQHNTLVLKSFTSSGAGNPVVEAVVTNTGAIFKVLKATFNISGGLWVSVYYLPDCPASITQVNVNYNGGAPGSVNLALVEVTGVGSNPLLAFIQGAAQTNPGTGADLITSGTVSVPSIPAYLLGIVTNAWNGFNTTTAGTNFTGRLAANANFFVEDRRETGATGSYAATAKDATHGAGATYDTTLIVFSDTLVIIQQPGSIAINSGDSSWLQVVALASLGSLSYQWQDNRSGSFANVIDGTGGTSQTYVTASLTTGATGRQYQCLVTDSNGTVTSSAATITVLATYNTTIATFDPELTIKSWYG